jgi:hypothetical protein
VVAFPIFLPSSLLLHTLLSILPSLTMLFEIAFSQIKEGRKEGRKDGRKEGRYTFKLSRFNESITFEIRILWRRGARRRRERGNEAKERDKETLPKKGM